MALPTLNWRRISAQTPSANTVEGVLNAIYDAFQETLYADGSTRTGEPTEWTMSRYQNVGVTEAVYGTPPLADVSDLRLIMAGADSGAPTPIMDSGVFDVYANSQINISINKNSGAYNAWDDASDPFTSGEFFGYWDALNLTTVTVSSVHVFESQEAIAVFFVRDDSTALGFVMGAIFDPMSDSPVDSEANHGRLYGMTKGADALGFATTIWTSGNDIFDHSDSGGAHHCGAFLPNKSGKFDLSRHVGAETLAAAYFLLPSGSPVVWPVALRKSDGVPGFGGRLREIMMFHTNQFGLSVKDSGLNVKGHIISGNTVATNYESFVLMK